MLVDKNMCTGCGNCILSCKVDAIFLKYDKSNNIYPVIDKKSVLVVSNVKNFVQCLIKVKKIK